MRCLYCGKTLALLKRLTGGGEFCSDAHRVKYQEEYNQLALSRLLQTQKEPSGASVGRTLVPADVPPPVLESIPPPPEDPPDVAPEAAAVTIDSVEPQAPVAEPEPVEASAPEPEPEPDPEPGLEPEPAEEPAPPMGTYLAPVIEISTPGRLENVSVEPATTRAGDIELPVRHAVAIVSPLDGEMDLAPRVAWIPEIGSRDMPVTPMARTVELREFSGKAELPGLALEPAPVQGVPVNESVSGLLEWTFAPYPGVEAAAAWSMTPAGFEEAGIETGALARLGYAHSGYEELAEAAAREPEPPAPAVREQMPLPVPDPKPAIRIVADPSHIEPARLERPRLEPVKFTPMPVPSPADPKSPASPPRPTRVRTMPPPPQPGLRPALNFAVNYGPAVPASGPMQYSTPAQEPAPHAAPPPYVAPGSQATPHVASAPHAVPQSPRYAVPGTEYAETAQPVPYAIPAAEYAEATAPTPYAAPIAEYAETVRAYPPAPGYVPPVSHNQPAAVAPVSYAAPPLPSAPAQQDLPPQAQPLYVFPAPVVSRGPVSYAAPQASIAHSSAVPVSPQVTWHGPPLLSAPEPDRPVMTVPPPKPETKPLAVTLHAMAAPAPKAALGRSEALQPASEPQVPRSSALPLRPLMYLDPAPASSAAGAKAESKDTAREAAPDTAPVEISKVKGKPHGKQKRADARVIPVEVPRAEPKPELKPEPKPELAGEPQEPAPKPLPKPLAAPATEVDLGLPTLQFAAAESRWATLPVAVKIGLAAAIVLALTGAAYLVMNSGSASAGQPEAAFTAAYEAGIPLVATGWVENWTKARAGRGPRLDILPSSMPLSDYRIEFRSEILSKATGWVYRALNPRNYYAAKLAITNAGPVPEVTLVRLAVIDGRQERSPDIKLPASIAAGKVNTVKFEAFRGKFTVWVQDKQVAEWTDRRIGSGGVGIYIDEDESALLRGVFRVTPLVAKQ